MWKQHSGIMLALDVENRAQAFRLLDLIGEDCDAIKFNYPLVLREGLSIVTEVKNRCKKPILCDFKVADVPVTNDRIIRICGEAGADGVMVHGFIGMDALQSAVQAAGNTALFLVTQMTNPGGLDFTAQFTDEFAAMARTFGLAGVQAPGNRPEVVRHVREIIGPDMMIVCCGIGAQGGIFGAAIEAGATFEIIGRAIYDAKDPVAKVAEIKAATRPFIKS